MTEIYEEIHVSIKDLKNDLFGLGPLTYLAGSNMLVAIANFLESNIVRRPGTRSP